MKFSVQVYLNLLIAFRGANSIRIPENDGYAAEEFKNESTTLSTTPTTVTITEQTTCTSLSPVNNVGADLLESISIQNILSAGIDGSDKINKKWANTLAELLSIDPKIDREIRLDKSGFSFPQKIVTASLSTGNVTFYNIKLSFDDLPDNYTKRFACDINKNAKIEIGLARWLAISANITVTNNSENIRHKGSISVTLNTPVLVKPLKITRNSKNVESDLPTKIDYNKFTVQIDVDKPFQRLAYQSVEVLLNEIEQPLADFFTIQLNNVLNERNTSQSMITCSKLFSKDHQTKQTDSPFFNNYANIYAIPGAKKETWNRITLNFGPVAIEGLSNITSVDISTTYKHIEQKYPDKLFAATIETGGLGGKFESHYELEENDNDKPLAFSFVIESAQFECTLYADYNQGRFRLDRLNVNGEVFLKNLQIKMSDSNSCSKEQKFVNIVLSKYLESIIVKSLKNSFQREFTNKLQSIQDFYNERLFNH